VPRLIRFLPPVGYGHEIAYRHLLVAYDGTSEGEEAVVAAGLLAERDQARLTIAAVVELERPSRLATRWSRGTGVWNDVLLDRARADLEHAARLASVPAELTVLIGRPDRALSEAVNELGCDAIVLAPRPRGRVRRLLRRDHLAAIRRRVSCEIVQPR
jgi:nucleotide-binding universal stress UspA family protein